jgi:hypothetical protein
MTATRVLPASTSLFTLAMLAALSAAACETKKIVGVDDKVARVELSTEQANITVGDTRTITAVLTNLSGQALTQNVTWSSSDQNVVRVAATAASAVVTAVGPGTATVTARSGDAFADAVFNVAPRPPETYTLNVTAGAGSSGSGTVTGGGISCAITAGQTSGVCQLAIAAGSIVTLTASASAGGSFAGWSEACAGSGTGSCSVTMSANRSVAASFHPPAVVTRTLTVNAGSVGTGNGTVTGGGMNCTITGSTKSGTCQISVSAGTSVTLTATPATGGSFAGWTDACSGTGTCTLVVNGNMTVTATFNPPVSATFTLTVVPGGLGTGAVIGGGISCAIGNGVTNGTCQIAVNAGTTIGLTATAFGGSTFAGWSGGGCTGGGGCSVTLNSNQTVTATFNPPPQPNTLTVNAAGTGSGTVTGGGVNCTITGGVKSGVCQVTANSGANITLSAVATGGSTFAGWSGAGCSGTGNCAVTLNSDQTVTATFNPPPPRTVTVNSGGAGSGTVTGNGINCTITNGIESGTCQITVNAGTTISLTAAPTGGSTFGGWSGGCTGTGACTVTVNSNLTITATFNPPQYTLTVNAGSTGSGTVSGGGISCTITNGVKSGTCQVTVNGGTNISLTAAATGGSTFGGWSGAGCTGTGGCSVTLNANQSVTATFNPAPPPTNTLTVNASGNGHGTVTGGGIDCTVTGGVKSGTCQVTVNTGTVVTLTATATGGSSFDGWTGGGCSGTGANCTITVNTDVVVTTTFTAPTPRKLTVNASITSNVSSSAAFGVSSTPTGINCQMFAGDPDKVCENFFTGTVTLFVNWTAAGWYLGSGPSISGGGIVCVSTSSTSKQCTVTMTQDRTVTISY